MPIDHVRIYREMKVQFDGIEAPTPEAAANIAHDGLTEDADDIQPCDGETFAALVDVRGDEGDSQSRLIDCKAERLRKAGPEVVAAVSGLLDAIGGLPITVLPGPFHDAVQKARTALTNATSKEAL